MEHRTFVVAVKPDGNLALLEGVQETPEEECFTAQNQFVESIDWESKPVCVGIEIEQRWHVTTPEAYEEYLQNVRDEKLGELIGQPSRASVDADSIVRERSAGLPDVQS